jgi:cell division protein FtsW (lipid II flippase)
MIDSPWVLSNRVAGITYWGRATPFGASFPFSRPPNQWKPTKEADLPLAIAGTGYGVIGVLVIILLIVLIFYFVRRA